MFKQAALWLLAFFVAITPTSAQTSRRVAVQPTDPLYLLVGEVSQDGSTIVGDGWVVPEDPCLVITNFHVAYGERGNPSGAIVFFENTDLGRKVRYSYAPDPTTKRFTKSTVAEVVRVGNFDEQDDTIANLREDMAALKLTECVSLPRSTTSQVSMDRSAENAKNPAGALATVSVRRDTSGDREIVKEVGCRAMVSELAYGVVGTNCEIVSGMSGSPLLRQGPGGAFTVVGMNTEHRDLPGGLRVALAISAGVLRKFLAE